jgi:hypothetical protein
VRLGVIGTTHRIKGTAAGLGKGIGYYVHYPF